VTRVLVLGANGQLGSDVTAAFAADGHDVSALTHQDIELTSLESVKLAFEKARPEIVINAAAFSNVERCETDPVLAFQVNALGARNVAQACRVHEATIVHISTDYVFDGAKSAPYTELDVPCPLNVYGNTKLSGEFFVRSANPRHFVVRVCGIYGRNPCRSKDGLNFVELMRKLSKERDEIRVVADEFVTPTPTVEIARQLIVLSRTSHYGLFHATAEGSCSWYEFARSILDLTGSKTRLVQARPGEFSAKVPRPRNSVLENAALKREGLNVFRHWREGLEEYLATRETPSVRGSLSAGQTR
jgi:dTDP-4-dehydrorhamnose reductase